MNKSVENAYNDAAVALGILVEAIGKKRIKRSALSNAADLLEQAAKALRTAE